MTRVQIPCKVLRVRILLFKDLLVIAACCQIVQQSCLVKLIAPTCVQHAPIHTDVQVRAT
jgi:hypothetical protein